MDQKHIECKVCKVVKLAIFDGYRVDGKNKVWLDENGQEFNGRTCPACHQAKTRGNMKKLRQERKNDR